MGRKFDQLSFRLNKIDFKDTDTKALTDNNETMIENLAVERNNSSLTRFWFWGEVKFSF